MILPSDVWVVEVHWVGLVKYIIRKRKEKKHCARTRGTYLVKPSWHFSSTWQGHRWIELSDFLQPLCQNSNGPLKVHTIQQYAQMVGATDSRNSPTFCCPSIRTCQSDNINIMVILTCTFFCCIYQVLKAGGLCPRSPHYNNVQFKLAAKPGAAN